ncbi:Glycine--tRNA ligase beta subunit [Gammaproteobacteria bacterium]
MISQHFLFELGSEELPPLALSKLSKTLERNILTGFEKAGLSFESSDAYATPRRLAVLVKNLSSYQSDRIIEKRGPALSSALNAAGDWTPAAKGFARSCGVDVNQLEKLVSEKGSWLVFRVREVGKSAEEVIPEILVSALAKLPIPKQMRWGSKKVEFVRPVHWAVALFGNQIIDTEILGKKTSRESYGHRFHFPEQISISTPEEYSALLEKSGRIIADFKTRREKIRAQVEVSACSLGGRAILEDALLEEVTSLVEWPVPIVGNFDPKFLEIPTEVLISTMQGKQKYFPIIGDSGKLLPHFITISNIESRDPKRVQEGNERVIRPRLADAAFFWEQDRRQPLESRIEDLKKVIFQDRLGSIHEKVIRVSNLASLISEVLKNNPQTTRRAAELSKCDLLTHLVGEFPELQGIIGRECARQDLESEEVAIAIEEQYLPRFSGDSLPKTPIGQILAVADRIDTLVGAFGIGVVPTGDKDPFGLRRAALGVLRILIEGHLHVDLIIFLKKAIESFQDNRFFNSPENVLQSVYSFMMDRLRGYFLEQGFQPDEFESVAMTRPSSPLDFHSRMVAVQSFRALPEASSLITANKRIQNILREPSILIPSLVEENLLQEPAEKLLFSYFTKLEIDLKDQNYQKSLVLLAGIKESVDTFFEETMVMTDDLSIRKNRLALLQKIRNLFFRVADISLLTTHS